MSLRKMLAKLLVLTVLEIGAVSGVPITPEKIQELMQMMNRARVVHVVKIDTDGKLPPLE